MSPRRMEVNPECIMVVADHFGISVSDVLDMPIRYFQWLHDAARTDCCEEGVA